MFDSYGIRVKKRLLEIGLTQNELCNQIGISKANLSMILTGKRKGWKHRDAIEKILRDENVKKAI